jgi:hypothetical protein
VSYGIDDKIVKNAIKSLKNEFGDIKFYEKNVMNGLETPCIFIRIIDSTFKRLIANRFQADFTLSLTYIPDKKDVKDKGLTHIQDVKLRLMSALESIETETGFLYASDISSETNYDDLGVTINMSCNFQVNYIKISDKYYMQKLHSEGSVKE